MYIFSHGLVGHRTTENTDDFKSPLVIAYYNVDYVKNPKGRCFKGINRDADSISQTYYFRHELLEKQNS